ncbi:hypothetical protein D7092_26295 [Ralstonia pickettii]|nr:hypothetical protein [Ralstonia pickettii]
MRLSPRLFDSRFLCLLLTDSLSAQMPTTIDRKREDDVVDRFSRKVHARMLELYGESVAGHPNFAASPLGGQDVELADYLLAGIGRYCLVEFKADEDSVPSEKRKSLRRALCESMQKNSAMLARAQAIHFVGWGTEEETNAPGYAEQTMYALGASLAPYPGMVCPLFGFTPAATVFGLMTDDAFIERFVSSELLGADAERFEKYVDELYAIAGHADADGKAGFQGTVYVYIAPSETRRANWAPFKFTGVEQLFRLTKEKGIDRAAIQERKRAAEKENTNDRGMTR